MLGLGTKQAKIGSKMGLRRGGSIELANRPDLGFDLGLALGWDLGFDEVVQWVEMGLQKD